ncbi:MAG: hypothetical protein IJE14_07630, partial [Clostridia bacterium]|nr:hypothetical protein [Clostridia bacterium]
SIDSFNGIVDINTLFFKSQENIMHEFIKKSIIVELGIRGINENEFNKYNILFHIISKKQDCIDLIQLGFENFTTLKQESKFGDIIVYKFHPHI